MSRLTQHYRVRLSTWDLWEIWLDATSPEEAEAEAKRIFTETGEDEFRHRECGFDGADVELYEEEALS